MDAPYHGNLIRWIADHGSVLAVHRRHDRQPARQHRLLLPGHVPRAARLVLDKGGLDMEHLAQPGCADGDPGVAAGDRGARDGLAAAPARRGRRRAGVDLVLAVPYDSLWRGPLWPYSRASRCCRPSWRSQAPRSRHAARPSYRRRGRRAGLAGCIRASRSSSPCCSCCFCWPARSGSNPSTGEPPGGVDRHGRDRRGPRGTAGVALAGRRQR